MQLSGGHSVDTHTLSDIHARASGRVAREEQQKNEGTVTHSRFTASEMERGSRQAWALGIQRRGWLWLPSGRSSDETRQDKTSWAREINQDRNPGTRHKAQWTDYLTRADTMDEREKLGPRGAVRQRAEGGECNRGVQADVVDRHLHGPKVKVTGRPKMEKQR